MNFLKFFTSCFILTLSKVICAEPPYIYGRSRSILKNKLIRIDKIRPVVSRSKALYRPKVSLIHSNLTNLAVRTLKHSQKETVSYKDSNKQVTGFHSRLTGTHKTRKEYTNSKTQIEQEVIYKRNQDVGSRILKAKEKSNERISDADQSEQLTKAARPRKTRQRKLPKGNSNSDASQWALPMALTETEQEMSPQNRPAVYHDILAFRDYGNIHRRESVPDANNIRFQNSKDRDIGLRHGYNSLARAKWYNVFASMLKPREQMPLRRARLNDGIHGGKAPQSLAHVLRVREMKLLKMLCHEVLKHINILRSPGRINAPFYVSGHRKIVEKLCWKINAENVQKVLFLDMTKQTERFYRFLEGARHKYQHILKRIRHYHGKKSFTQEGESSALHIISEKNRKSKPLNNLELLHPRSLMNSDREIHLTLNGDVVERDNSLTKSQEKITSPGYFSKLREMMQRITNCVESFFSVLKNFYHSLRHVLHTLFGQISKAGNEKRWKKLHESPRAVQTHVTVNLGRQDLSILTNEKTSRWPNLIHIMKNYIEFLYRPLSTYEQRGNRLSFSLHILRNQWPQHKKSGIKEHKDDEKKTMSKMQSKSIISVPNQNSVFKQHKKEEENNVRIVDFQHKKLKEKRKSTPYIAIEFMNVTGELNGTISKNMHSSDPKWKHEIENKRVPSKSDWKYSSLESRQYLWEANGNVSDVRTPGSLKWHFGHGFEDLLKQPLNTKVEPMQEENHVNMMNVMNDRKIPKSDGARSMSSSGSGRRHRRAALGTEHVYADPKLLRPYLLEYRKPSYDIPIHRHRKQKIGKYTNTDDIDPLRYSWKNIKDLPDDETEILRGKLFHLMQLVREKTRDNQVKDTEFNQNVEPLLMGTQEENGGKRLHIKHPTSADRRLLHNIELLTFSVLGKPDQATSDDEWGTRKVGARRPNAVVNESLFKSDTLRNNNVKKSVIKGHMRHPLRKRAAQSFEIHDLNDLRRNRDKLDIDVDDDIMDSFIRTEVKHNTFPERWKSLKHQLSLLDKQMTKTKNKYASIQKKIQSLIKEGEVLAEKAEKNIGQSESEEALARNSLSKLETEKEKIEKKIKDEEERREKIEEEFMRSGITGKVDSIKDELARHEYRLHGANSMENVDFDPMDRKYVTRLLGSVVTGNEGDNKVNFLDSDDDMLGVEASDDLKSVHHGVRDSMGDEDLHDVDTMLDRLLENRVRRSSGYQESRHTMDKQALTSHQDQIIEADQLSLKKRLPGDSVTENHDEGSNLRIKGKDEDFNNGQSKNKYNRDFKVSKIVKRDVADKDTKKYESTTLVSEATSKSNPLGTTLDGRNPGERTLGGKTMMEDKDDVKQTAMRSHVKKNIANAFFDEKEQWHTSGLDHDTSQLDKNDDLLKNDASQPRNNDGLSDKFIMTFEPRESNTHQRIQFQKAPRKRKESKNEQNQHKSNEKEEQETMRKILDLQLTMEEATKDLNTLFERTKEAREKQWAKEDEGRKEREKEEGKFLGNLMQEIDEMLRLRKMKSVEPQPEKNFLMEAENDLKKRKLDETKWMKVSGE